MNRSLTGTAAFRRRLRRAWVDVAIFSTVINVFLLVPSIYMMQVYDRVLPSASISTLVYLSLIAVGSLAFLALMDMVRAIYCQRVAMSLDRDLGGAAFLASINSPRAERGDTEALRDLSTVRTFIASRGLANLTDLPFAPLFIILLFFVHPVLSFVTIGGAVVMVLLVVANQFAARGMNGKAQEVSVSANLLAQSFARHADTVRGMGMIDHVTGVWGKRFAESSLLQDRASIVNSIFSGSSRTLRMALQLAILGTGAVLVMKGEMTAGMIFASSTISGRALQPIDQLVAGWRQVIEARKAWGRLNTAIATVEDLNEPRVRLPEPQGRVSVKDLVWTPPQTVAGAAPVIKRLNFEILPGEVVALLGPSGAGKSTLARLLAGIVRPSAGTVALDGADYRTWDAHQLGGYIGYLAQDVQLLPGSIAQNIARFDPAATDEGITGAALRAEAHALVTVQKQGYQTVVSAGNALSGGTRQRIGLARAFYGNPKLLILDEPNANLDADGEAALEKALVQAKEAGTTIVIITHRPAIVLRCDKAMVLRDGAVDAFGPASEVLRRLAGNGARSGPAETKVRKSDAFSRPNPQPISAEKLSLVQNDAD